MKDPKPDPGSPKAISDGCRCPRMDNHNGAGRWGNGDKYGWFVSEKCSLHAIPVTVKP